MDVQIAQIKILVMHVLMDSMVIVMANAYLVVILYVQNVPALLV